MSSLIFDIASDGIAKQTIDWLNDTIQVLLLTGNGLPVKSNATVAAVLGEANVDECVATAYTRKTLANKAITTAGNQTLFDADNPVWATLGGASNETITGALIYKFVSDDSDSIPIMYADLADIPTNGGQVTLTKDATTKFFYLDNS